MLLLETWLITYNIHEVRISRIKRNDIITFLGAWLCLLLCIISWCLSNLFFSFYSYVETGCVNWNKILGHGAVYLTVFNCTWFFQNSCELMHFCLPIVIFYFIKNVKNNWFKKKKIRIDPREQKHKNTIRKSFFSLCTVSKAASVGFYCPFLLSVWLCKQSPRWIVFWVQTEVSHLLDYAKDYCMRVGTHMYK